ncbi:Uncharacterized protein FWK35_00018171, partial [Aphis craccivora]
MSVDWTMLFNPYISDFGIKVAGILNVRDRVNLYIAGLLNVRDALLKSNGYDCIGICRQLVQNNDLNGLKFIYNNRHIWIGYKIWDEKTCSLAAKGGYLDCLQYAHENGCPWNRETCEAAAEYGHLN